MASWGRIAVVGAAGLLGGMLILANAIASSAPAALSGLWPGHPAVLYPASLAELGESGSRGERPRPELIESMIQAGQRDPLAAEPLLVRGIAAGETGALAVAGRAFVAARAREPRNPATRYFLADHYLKTGDVDAALAEFAMVGRVSPKSRQSLGEALAAYAVSPGGASRIAPILDRDANLRAATLARLAQRPENAELVMRLGRRDRSTDAIQWQNQLILTLLTAGNVAAAKSAWDQFMGQRGAGIDRGFIRDPTFADRRQAPPFGWYLYSGSAGLAEASGGGLRAIHYGREAAVLARQLLVLEPGRYALGIGKASGQVGTLRWRIRCEGSTIELLSVTLSADALGGSAARPFTVPTSNCPGQWIELLGSVGEEPSDAQLGRVSLARVR